MTYIDFYDDCFEIDLCEISDFVGKTFSKVTVERNTNINDVIQFIINDNEKYVMCHKQHCCENVEIEDVCGELEQLEGSPILKATEDENSQDLEDYLSCTWTFYNIATQKGYVTIRWYGRSNGYYSEKADIYRFVKKVQK